MPDLIRHPGIRLLQDLLDPGVRLGDTTEAFYESIKVDGLVKSRLIPFSVIPAEAGIQSFQAVLDPGVRLGNTTETFYESIKMR